MAECSVNTFPPTRHRVSGAIALGPGLVLQGVHMRFHRNEEIFGEGEPATYVYRVVSGAVRSTSFSNGGRRQILSFHTVGDVFGLEAGGAHTLTAEAVSDTEVALVRRSLVDAAAADPLAAHGMIALMHRHLLDAQTHALLLGRKGACERVAAFLLNLADRCGQRSEIDLPMSRADIADYLALTIETVSRAFTQMEREHTIELPRSRHVVVRDRGALEMFEAA
ncbi:MAG: helix-turn-helix domain-containing protein [Terricaulis sp.]